MDDPYTDAPLSQHKGSQEFRLLDLHSCKPSEPIRCTLRTSSFDSDPPSYTALSYTWGPKAKPKTIQLNGLCFPVGYNLWSFLEEMRLQKRFRTFWIDAICINQESMQERNHQVQIMRRIYSNAESVSIWLGEADEASTSDTAMEFLEKRSAITKISPVTFQGLFQSDVESAKTFTPDELVEQAESFIKLHVWPAQQTTFPWSEKEAKAISKLYRRRYWSRIWIVQEIVLAREPVVYCGSKKVAWRSLERLCYDLLFSLTDVHLQFPEREDLERELRTEMEAQKFVCLLSMHRQLYHTGTVLSSLSELVEQYRDQETTDVLDKVYALCGLARDGDDLTINYGVSADFLLIKLIDHVCKLGWKKDDIYDVASSYASTLGVKWR
ncbi:hypothetical protein J4E91_007948 [Alternaria rosae]|nr:hypothetical protein J4E91_007948 [Alternaria rosae]